MVATPRDIAIYLIGLWGFAGAFNFARAWQAHPSTDDGMSVDHALGDRAFHGGTCAPLTLRTQTARPKPDGRGQRGLRLVLRRPSDALSRSRPLSLLP